MYTFDLLIKFRRKKVDMQPIWDPGGNSILAILTTLFSNLSAHMVSSFLRTVRHVDAEAIIYAQCEYVCVSACLIFGKNVG